MKKIQIKDEYYDELYKVWSSNPEWAKERKMDTIDKFIEEIAMFGLHQFRKPTFMRRPYDPRFHPH